MEPGVIVEAVDEFTPENEKDLPLQTGDIVLVTKKLDDQWSLGLCNGIEGSFPSSYVKVIPVPPLEEDQALFAPIIDYVPDFPEDLSFNKGDLVVGLRVVDSNWWQGQTWRNGKFIENHGIFPLTFVWKIDRNLLQKPTEKVSLMARVKMDLKAMEKEEIDLTKGDIVHITEKIDKRWYRGECNGRTGIFPAQFVDVITNGVQELAVPVSANEHQNAENVALVTSNGDDFNTYGYDCVNSGISSYCQTKYQFEAKFDNELSFPPGQIVILYRHVNEDWLEGEYNGRIGCFPKNHVEIIVDCSSENKSSSQALQTMRYPPETYAMVTSDFDPQSKREVKLSKGDTVKLIQRINETFIEVLTEDCETCLCPLSCIEEIGSAPDMLPPSYSEVVKADRQNLSRNITGLSGCDTGSFPCRDRPVSYPSSTSSTSNDVPFKASYSIDAKIAENLSLLDSSCSSESSHNSSSHQSSFRSSSYLSDRSPSAHDRSNLSSNQSLSPISYTVQNDGSADGSCSRLFGTKEVTAWDVENEPSRTRALKAPVRPPLPANAVSAQILGTSENNSSATGRSNTLDADALKQKLADKEAELKKLVACRSKLENEKHSNQNDKSVKNLIHSDVLRFNKEIQNLNGEIVSLKKELLLLEDSTVSTPATNASVTAAPSVQISASTSGAREDEEQRRAKDRKKKTEEQRSCVITEILQTERDYLSDLKILYDVFLRNPQEGKDCGVDLNTLFGNLEEVIDVASRLLRRLEKTRCAPNPMIGECFVGMSEEMKEVYGHYCRNHDEVNAVLEKYEEKSSAGQYLKHKVELLKRQTNCFDLPSMLIKPVQRILKYPLLLNELVKYTDDVDPDKPCLLKAIELMTDVATAINEFKRRQDLVFKYRKHTDTSLSGRISKFSFHSMWKKSSRFGMRLSNTIGLTSVIKDEQFEKLEREFHGLEKIVKIFIKDVNGYIEKMEETVKTAFSLAEDIAELYGDRKNQQEVEQFRSVHRMIVTQFFETNKQVLERNVLNILKDLLQTFHGPNFLIQKRFDKLLDYEACTNKMEKNKDATKIKALQDNQQIAKNTYEALNMQLLDDLPKFYSTSVEIICDCVRCFLKARKNFIGKCAREMLSLAKLPLLIGSQVGCEGASGIISTFQVKHTLVTDSLCQMSIVPNQLFPASGTGTLRKSSSPSIGRVSFGTSPMGKQSASQKAYVMSNYSQPQLYTASTDFDGVDVMDLSLKKGDVVGVLKMQNSMGSKLKWFVDNGVSKGFVPAKVLEQSWMDVSPSSPTMPFAPGQPQHQSFGKASINTTFPPFSISLPRNSQNRRSLPNESMDRKKMQDSSYAVSKKSATTPKSAIMLKPVRPAPPPYEQVDSLHSTAREAGKSAILDGQTICQSQNVPLPTIVMSASSDSPQSHRYEEIDELNDRYDMIAEDTNLTSLNQSCHSPNVTVQEFDPYAPVSQQQGFYDNVPDNEQSFENNRYEVIDEGDDAEEADTSEYYYAMYDFNPSGSNQLSLTKGQVVLVLHKCDLNQNPDWWFVENRHGNKGYVPGNYLNIYPKFAASGTT